MECNSTMTSPDEQPAEQSPDTPPVSNRRFSRRRFLAYSAAGAGVLVTGSAANAWLVEPHGFVIRRIRIPLRRLPAAWDGVNIAHLSDLHIGPYSDTDHLRDIIAKTNRLQPDITVVTGDFVSRASAITPAVAEVFRDLRGGPCYGVLGNHDHWTDAPEVMRHFASAGVRFFVNEHETLHRRGQPLCIAGVDDLWRREPFGPDLEASLDDVPEDHCRILLCHNPDFAEDMPPTPRVDLMLAGHTHGGQVRLPLLGAPVLPIRHRKYADGLVQGPHCPVFISRGLGMVSPPVRFLCRPEIVLITLRRT